MIDTTVKAKKAEYDTTADYYKACGFDEEDDSATESFTNFMQSALTVKPHQIVVPQAICTEDSFNFYAKGKDLWKSSLEFRETIEDKFRHQLE